MTVQMWASPSDDNAKLCETCGLNELNNSLSVAIRGHEYQSLDEAVAFMESFAQEMTGLPFLVKTYGTCLNCGVTTEEEKVVT